MANDTIYEAVSAEREKQIYQAVPYQGMGGTNWKLRAALYFVAGRADALRAPGEVAAADAIDELLDDMFRALERGAL